MAASRPLGQTSAENGCCKTRTSWSSKKASPISLYLAVVAARLSRFSHHRGEHSRSLSSLNSGAPENYSPEPLRPRFSSTLSLIHLLLLPCFHWVHGLAHVHLTKPDSLSINYENNRLKINSNHKSFAVPNPYISFSPSEV